MRCAVILCVVTLVAVTNIGTVWWMSRSTATMAAPGDDDEWSQIPAAGTPRHEMPLHMEAVQPERQRRVIHASPRAVHVLMLARALRDASRAAVQRVRSAVPGAVDAAAAVLFEDMALAHQVRMAAPPPTPVCNGDGPLEALWARQLSRSERGAAWRRVLNGSRPGAMRRGRALLTVTVGQQHIPNVLRMLQVFDEQHFDVWLFHWDSDEPTMAWQQAGLLDDDKRRIRHVWRQGGVKLTFARTHLHPAAVAEYTHVFQWDGDGVIDERTFDPIRYLDVAVASGAAVSQPVLTAASRSDYAHNRQSPAGNAWCAKRVTWVEVGFWVWDTRAWTIVWNGALSLAEFRYWCADLLPIRCIIHHWRRAALRALNPFVNATLPAVQPLHSARTRVHALADWPQDMGAPWPAIPMQQVVVGTDAVHHEGSEKSLKMPRKALQREHGWHRVLRKAYACSTGDTDWFQTDGRDVCLT